MQKVVEGQYCPYLCTIPHTAKYVKGKLNYYSVSLDVGGKMMEIPWNLHHFLHPFNHHPNGRYLPDFPIVEALSQKVITFVKHHDLSLLDESMKSDKPYFTHVSEVEDYESELKSKFFEGRCCWPIIDEDQISHTAHEEGVAYCCFTAYVRKNGDLDISIPFQSKDLHRSTSKQSRLAGKLVMINPRDIKIRGIARLQKEEYADWFAEIASRFAFQAGLALMEDKFNDKITQFQFDKSRLSDIQNILSYLKEAGSEESLNELSRFTLQCNSCFGEEDAIDNCTSDEPASAILDGKKYPLYLNGELFEVSHYEICIISAVLHADYYGDFDLTHFEVNFPDLSENFKLQLEDYRADIQLRGDDQSSRFLKSPSLCCEVCSFDYDSDDERRWNHKEGEERDESAIAADSLAGKKENTQGELGVFCEKSSSNDSSETTPLWSISNQASRELTEQFKRETSEEDLTIIFAMRPSNELNDESSKSLEGNVETEEKGCEKWFEKCIVS